MDLTLHHHQSVVVLIWEDWDWALGKSTQENEKNNQYGWVSLILNKEHQILPIQILQKKQNKTNKQTNKKKAYNSTGKYKNEKSKHENGEDILGSHRK